MPLPEEHMTLAQITATAAANPKFKRFARETDLASPWCLPTAMTKGYLRRWYGKRPFLPASHF